MMSTSSNETAAAMVTRTPSISASHPSHTQFHTPQPAALPHTQYCAVTPNVKVAFVRYPSGVLNSKRRPVLLIFGWTCLKEDWHGLPWRLSALGHEVVSYDHRGLGESTMHNEADGPFTMQQLADDAAALIRYVFPGQKAHAIGFSMGGLVAQSLGARHTGLVASLVLGCTNLSILRPLEPPSIVWSLLADQRALAWKLMAHGYSREWLAAHSARFEQLVDESVKHRRSYITAGQMNRAMEQFDGAPQAHRLRRTPILILHGRRDRVVPVAQAHILARHLAMADLVLLDGVGHLFWTTAEAPMHRALADFLNKVERFMDEEIAAIAHHHRTEEWVRRIDRDRDGGPGGGRVDVEYAQSTTTPTKNTSTGTPTVRAKL